MYLKFGFRSLVELALRQLLRVLGLVSVTSLVRIESDGLILRFRSSCLI